MNTKVFLQCCTVGLALSSAALAAPAAPLLATNTANIFSYPAPPQGFDAFNASQEALARYGFPPRPGLTEGSAARRQWDTLIRASRTRIQPILQATSIVNGPAQHGGKAMRPNAQGVGQYASKNWSGEVLANNARVFGPGAFTSLATTFVLPVAMQAYGACTGGWDYMSNWAGIDGWVSTDVFQAGTESDAYCANGTTQAYYSAWVEWYPANEIRITNLPVSPGDVMLVWMIAQSATTGLAIVANLTTSQTVFMNMTAPPNTSLVGNSAEWIIERPMVNKQNATLSNYIQSWMGDENAVEMGNGQGGNFGAPPLGASANLITMDDDTGAAISSATPAGGTVADFKVEGSAK